VLANEIDPARSRPDARRRVTERRLERGCRSHE
jgi:hypothetical protein